MSAVVCGKRSSFFEDHTVPSSSSASPPASKRIRCFSSSSPVQFSSATPSSRFFALDRLIALFPDMDKQVRYLLIGSLFVLVRFSFQKEASSIYVILSFLFHIAILVFPSLSRKISFCCSLCSIL